MSNLRAYVEHCKRKLERSFQDKDMCLSVVVKLSALPVTKELLDSTGLWKIVRQLSQQRGELGDRAGQLCRRWKKLCGDETEKRAHGHSDAVAVTEPDKRQCLGKQDVDAPRIPAEQHQKHDIIADILGESAPDLGRRGPKHEVMDGQPLQRDFSRDVPTRVVEAPSSQGSLPSTRLQFGKKLTNISTADRVGSPLASHRVPPQGLRASRNEKSLNHTKEYNLPRNEKSLNPTKEYNLPRNEKLLNPTKEYNPPRNEKPLNPTNTKEYNPPRNEKLLNHTKEYNPPRNEKSLNHTKEYNPPRNEKPLNHTKESNLRCVDPVSRAPPTHEHVPLLHDRRPHPNSEAFDNHVLSDSATDQTECPGSDPGRSSPDGIAESSDYNQASSLSIGPSVDVVDSPSKRRVPEPYAIAMREGMFRAVKTCESVPQNILKLQQMYDTERGKTKNGVASHCPKPRKGEPPPHPDAKMKAPGDKTHKKLPTSPIPPGRHSGCSSPAAKTMRMVAGGGHTPKKTPKKGDYPNWSLKSLPLDMQQVAGVENERPL